MPGKLIPQPDDLTLELFQAIAATGQMHVQQCADCGAYTHPPRYYCARCFSPRYRMAAVSGAGTVYSHTLSHYTTEPAWKDDVPYATVVVELDEGPRIVGAARHPDPAAIRIGQRARVIPEPRTDDFSFLTVQFDDARYPGPDRDRRRRGRDHAEPPGQDERADPGDAGPAMVTPVIAREGSKAFTEKRPHHFTGA